MHNVQKALNVTYMVFKRGKCFLFTKFVQDMKIALALKM